MLKNPIIVKTNSARLGYFYKQENETQNFI